MIDDKALPRLGSSRENLVEILIEENDSPHGIIEFSNSVIYVSEDDEDLSDQEEGFLKVVRRLGSFGNINLRFKITPGSATANEDFTVLTNEVT